MCGPGLLGLPPQTELDLLLTADPLEVEVGLHAGDEVLSALGVLDVLNADVDPLGQDVSANALVHDDSQGVLCHVEHTASLSVVGLEGHALLYGTITLETNNNQNISQPIISTTNLTVSVIATFLRQNQMLQTNISFKLEV